MFHSLILFEPGLQGVPPLRTHGMSRQTQGLHLHRDEPAPLRFIQAAHKQIDLAMQGALCGRLSRATLRTRTDMGDRLWHTHVSQIQIMRLRGRSHAISLTYGILFLPNSLVNPAEGKGGASKLRKTHQRLVDSFQ